MIRASHHEVGPHRLYVGDNLHVMTGLADESVGLIYMDPPFNTAVPRAALNDAGQIARFDDNFGTVAAYIEWMRPRIGEAIRLLKSGGALFLHCDYRTSHYLRVTVDELLGHDNLINEIVWKRHNAHSDSGQGSQHFGRNADTILFYRKGEASVWNPQYVPYDPTYVDRAYRHEEGDGRRYALTDLSGPGGSLNGNPEFQFMGITRSWRYSARRLEELTHQGRIVVTSKGRVPRRKRYLDEMPGREVQTIWDDIPRMPNSERVGYPTQKPVALLTRIIASSTTTGDSVLDPFCGSGTTLVAAEELGRRAVGIDCSRGAISVATQRLRNLLERTPKTMD